MPQERAEPGAANLADGQKRTRDLGYSQTDSHDRGHYRSPSRKTLNQIVNGVSALWNDHGAEM